MAEVNSHLDNITINISLDPAPATSQGFDMLLIVPLATNTLDGDRFRTYTGTADVATDLAASFISATVATRLNVAFAQRPAPAQVLAGYADLVGGETYGTAIALIRAAGASFYGVSILVRTDAEVLIAAAAMESDRGVFLLQSSDSDWLTTALPAALTALAVYERTIICFHDTDTEGLDLALGANRLAYDPDVQSVPWDAPVNGVAALATAPNSTQKGFLDTNFANHGLPYGGAPVFVDAGVNAVGRPFYEMFTADWFEIRLEERVAIEKVKHSARGEKLTVDATGQAKILAILDGLGAQGVGAGHFTEFDFEPVTIIQADIDAQRFRFTGVATFAVSGRKFQFDLNFTRTPIASL